MKIYTTIAIFFVLSLVIAAPEGVRTVSVTVVGDDRSPISDAQVKVAFLGYSGDEDRIIMAIGEKGRYSVSGSAALRINVAVEKEGYYKSYIERLNRKKDHDLEVVLRRKDSPRPLYARDAFLRFPANRTWLGYDLKAGDWVAPHGEGKVVDAEFRCDTEKTGIRDARGSLDIRFPEGAGLCRVSEEDGYLPRSEMKMPHEAPEGGYGPTLRRVEESFRNRNAETNIGYFLRSRVLLDPEDRVVFAHYGKILGDVKFSPRWKTESDGSDRFATVWFTYYFNPEANERNLEFDPGRNLFGELDPGERVAEP